MLIKVLYGVVGTLIAVLLVAVGFLGRVITEPEGARAVDSVAQANAAVVDQEFGILGEIAKVLGEDYVESDRAKAEVLLDGALNGIFETLNDPHSAYITPDDYALQRSDFEGAFEGIGATVAKQDDWLVIVQPLPNTPAEKAGLKPGDIILSVDGDSAQGWTVEQGVLRIRGKVGTTVKIGIRHADGKEEVVSIARASIKQSSVSTTPPGGKVTDASGAEVTDYAYIQIRSFTRTTPDEVKAAIEEAKKRNARGLILDVRGNPGGLLSETIQIADMLLDKGGIVIQVDRAGTEQTASATAGVLTDLPVVVLQDQFSASGAELLAAAVKENNRGTVVGTRSFGKGTVNYLRELSNGGAVYVSIARWLTPAR
ncbi:MAG: S41 family peptidase, partial [Chloroflexi bacterium]|nr:S41 family peptidase [Chloroflexota bacterium]